MKSIHAFAAVATLLTGSVAFAQDKITFATNWLAQAEHGGHYQAVADGTFDQTQPLRVIYYPEEPGWNEIAAYLGKSVRSAQRWVRRSASTL